jgi:deoxycytidine triphosphate deaminase
MEPYDYNSLEEWGYKLHTGETLYRLKEETVMLCQTQEYTTRKIGDKGINLNPGELYLIETLEWIKMNSVTGATIPLQDAARKGVKVETGAIDVGFNGNLLVPITVVKTTTIYVGIPFIKFAIYDMPLADRRTRYEGNFHLPETKSYRGEKDDTSSE